MPKITNDVGHLETEAEIKKLEKEIRKEYQKAAKEVEDKLNKYMSSFSAKDEIKKKQVADKILTQEEYEKWRIGQLAVGKRWDEMKNSLAFDLANTSEIARSTARGYMPEVYALNHNYATFQVEKSSLLDTSYTLYDRQTVERLFREKPKLMPPMSAKTAEKIRQGKLVKWNEQKIQSSVMQGILQGESIPKIARRMRDVTDMNYKASIRNARTSITSAQNGGRMDAYHRAEDMGIHQKKQWLATLDDRTRHEHVDLDGQRRDLDEPFEVDGYEIMFPGDPSADPAMVYNCRCTMITVFDGYDKQVSDFDLSQNEKLGDMTYDEWKKEHEKEKPAEKHVVVQGKDISDTWVRRPEQFDFEIEDVINAQGFDGVPRVVSSEEFDKAVKESNIICQRGYKAKDEEVLKSYQNELYNGKWYVDCSKGGAAYGKGMYSGYSEGTKIDDHLERIGEIYGGSKSTPGIVETFTLTPDAKIISRKELIDMYEDDFYLKWKRDGGRDQFIQRTSESIASELNLNDTEKKYMMSRYFDAKIDDEDKIIAWYKGLSDSEADAIDKRIESYGTDNLRKIMDTRVNENELAVLMGYDAVKVENEGYLIVLNRTKCIFRKGG